MFLQFFRVARNRRRQRRRKQQFVSITIAPFFPLILRDMSRIFPLVPEYLIKMRFAFRKYSHDSAHGSHDKRHLASGLPAPSEYPQGYRSIDQPVNQSKYRPAYQSSYRSKCLTMNQSEWLSSSVHSNPHQ